MRDIKKQAQQGRELLEKNSRLDLSAGELDQFYDSFDQILKEKGLTDAIFHTVGDAFKMGLAVGARNFNK